MASAALIPPLTEANVVLAETNVELGLLDPFVTQVATGIKKISETIKNPLKEIGQAVAEATETVSDITKPIEDLNARAKMEAEIEAVVEKKVIQDTKEAILNAKTPEEMENAISKGEEKIDTILQTGDDKIIGQNGGGKKILARTNKSIAQFLNSKVTFKSILKRMTSKYKRGKGVKRMTKRQYKR